MNEHDICFTKHIPNRLQNGLLVLFIYIFALGRWTDFEFYVLSFGTDDGGMGDNKGAR